MLPPVGMRPVGVADARRMERLAKRERISVSALAVRELAEAARLIDNVDLLGARVT